LQQLEIWQKGVTEPCVLMVNVASKQKSEHGVHACCQAQCLEIVLPPENRSIAEVSRETGVNEQTIRNWIRQSQSGILADGSRDSTP
jgi:transposase-like protein